MTKEKLNLGAAFERLKNDEKSLFKAIVETDIHVKSDEPDKYAYAYGQLSAAVKGYLFMKSDMKFDEVNDVVKANLEQK